MTTVPSTGEVKFSDLRSVFNGATPVNLSDYYANATSSNVTGVSGIPSIGSAMSISVFRGKSKPVIFSTHTFTNAGATGRFGPTLIDCQNAYSSQSWSGNTSHFNMTTQGYQLWTVPITSTYEITCAGAKGGNSSNTGFAGRIVRGVFSLTAGQVVTIVVGQIGLNRPTSVGGGGGGGGSFVIYNGSPLIVAGGGGGAGNNTNGSAGVFSPSGSGTGGTGLSGQSGGGGGYNGNGFSGGGGGGLGYTNGLIGGNATDNFSGSGGFGGGGAASAFNGWSGAGGGGYTGGNGSLAGYDSGGGGGTCFGTDITNIGTNTDNGYVTITSMFSGIINAPIDPVFSVSAYSLSNQTTNTKVTNWGLFNQGNSSLQPTYISGFPNIVRFTGDALLHNFVTYSPGTLNLNYGTGGGATIIILARYNNLIQFNRTISHGGGSGNSGVLEWIIAENPGVLSVKYFFTNSTGVVTTNAAHIPIGKIGLYVARFNNATNTAQLFRNNVQIATRSHNPLVNSTIGNIWLGAQGGAPGNNTDLIYASLYTRPLSDTELTSLYDSVSSICEN